MKSKLAKLATVHVYSLQKAPLQDCSLLHAFDDKLTEEQLFEYPKWSSIKCSAVERPPPNREGSSTSVKSAVDVKFSTEKPPTLSFMETNSAPVLSREEKAAEREMKDSAPSKKGASGGSKVKGKSGVAAMFNRMTDLEQKGKPTAKEDKRTKKEELASSVPSKGKHSPKKKHVKKVSGMELQEETSVEPVATVSAAAAETEDDSRQAGKKSDSRQAGKKSDSGQAGKKSDSGQAGKKRTAQETSKGAKNAEKRRRIVVFSSDSEDEQHEKESESCKENLYTTQDEAKTKKVEPVTTTTSMTVQKRRKRVRRLKSRMFEDSDGSMSEFS